MDKTGISGIFNLRLEFAMDDPTRVVSPAGDPTDSSISAALQEQLGLKLESARGPVEVLVVDSVSKPIEN